MIVEQRDQPRHCLFRVERFERVDRKDTHRGIVVIERIEQRAYRATGRERTPSRISRTVAEDFMRTVTLTPFVDGRLTR